MERIFLSRRNLQTLLNKLDLNKENPGSSFATIIKQDSSHPKYPQTMIQCMVTALENEEYYTDREPGEVRDAPK